jgi:hypothetical protein
MEWTQKGTQKKGREEGDDGGNKKKWLLFRPLKRPFAQLCLWAAAGQSNFLLLSNTFNPIPSASTQISHFALEDKHQFPIIRSFVIKSFISFNIF